MTREEAAMYVFDELEELFSIPGTPRGYDIIELDELIKYIYKCTSTEGKKLLKSMKVFSFED